MCPIVVAHPRDEAGTAFSTSAGREVHNGDMPDPEQRFRQLPEPVRLEDTVGVHEVAPPLDPEGGRDTDAEFLLRYN